MKVLTLEEIIEEYKYGNYSDDSARLLNDVCVYITSTYGLSLQQANIVARGVYEARKTDMRKFFSSIDFAAKIATNVKEDICQRITEALDRLKNAPIRIERIASE